MEKLQSSEIKQLISALVKAKKKFHTVIFDKKGHKNQYATLGSILDSVEYPLLEEEIVIEFKEDYNTDLQIPLLYTRIVHSSGEWSANKVLIIPDNNQSMSECQRYGSSLSYARRYSLLALLGLFADNEDPDNHDNSKKSNTSTSTSKPVKIETINKDQEKIIRDEVGDDEIIVKKIFETLNINNLANIPSGQYEKCLNFIRRNKAIK